MVHGTVRNRNQSMTPCLEEAYRRAAGTSPYGEPHAAAISSTAARHDLHRRAAKIVAPPFETTHLRRLDTGLVETRTAGTGWLIAAKGTKTHNLAKVLLWDGRP